MNNPFIKYDTKKGVDFSAWGGIEGFLADTSNGAGGGKTETLLKRISPWLSRAVNMTAVSIANLPFDIVDKKVLARKVEEKPDKKVAKPFDSSEDWQNKLGGMPNPRRLLYLLASSLCGGKAYLYPELTERMLADLVYLAPHTIQPQIDRGGLQWFDRASDEGKVDKFGPDELVYFWLPDSDIELGPARVHPIGAAVIAAQTASDMDASVRLLADRHFVPATIVGAKGMANQQAREQAENWLTRFFRGAFQTSQVKVMNAEAVSVVKVGGGMEDLKTGFTEIQRGEIEAIGAAFGIPSGLFMADKAYATEMDALIRMWYSSSQFISIYQCIEETFNDQLFVKWDKRMKFKPETLDAFQEDETQRAQSFKLYTDAGMRPSIVAEMLGLELPEGAEFSALDEKFDKPDPVDPRLQLALMDKGKDPEKIPQGIAQSRPRKGVVLDADQQKEIVLWRQRATAWHRKGKGGASEWECKHLPEDIASAIRLKLAASKDELDIVKAFEINTETDGDGLWAVAEALNRLADK